MFRNVGDQMRFSHTSVIFVSFFLQAVYSYRCKYDKTMGWHSSSYTLGLSESVCQCCLIICVEARIAVQRGWLAEFYTFEDGRVDVFGRFLYDDDLGIDIFK